MNKTNSNKNHNVRLVSFVVSMRQLQDLTPGEWFTRGRAFTNEVTRVLQEELGSWVQVKVSFSFEDSAPDVSQVEVLGAGGVRFHAEQILAMEEVISTLAEGAWRASPSKKRG